MQGPKYPIVVVVVGGEVSGIGEGDSGQNKLGDKSHGSIL